MSRCRMACVSASTNMMRDLPTHPFVRVIPLHRDLRKRYAEETLRAYERYASAAIASWARQRRVPALLRRFVRRLSRGASVLDYGCGIGTDLAWMRARGLRVEGIDGTRAFVEEGRRRCPGAPIRHARFETATLGTARYDGIWCRAALIHVPPEVLREQLATLRRALRPGGWLAITLAWGRSRAFLNHDWIPGRYVAAYSKAEVSAYFRAWTVQELRVTHDEGRQGRWVQVLASA